MDTFNQIQGILYVGGGEDSFKGHTIIEYDTTTEKWASLPPYSSFGFAMTSIGEQLTLVGGYGNAYSKVLGVWRPECKTWAYPYPEMLIARSRPSVVVHKEWLVIAGGQAVDETLSNVEVLNTETKKWFTGPLTPVPWENMKTAVVGNMTYFMGGKVYDERVDTSKVYCVHTQNFISCITSKKNTPSEASEQLWTELPELQLTGSAPLSIEGSLLVLGGKDKEDHKTVTDIFLYQSEKGQWVKVGDLPSPRRECTCIMTEDGELLVAGGYATRTQFLKTVDIALSFFRIV